MYVLSSLLCPRTLMSGGKKNTKLKQTAALKASVVLAFPARKKLVHHAPRIYAVLQAEAFVCVLPRNQLDSTHTVYIKKCQGFFFFFETLRTCVTLVSIFSSLLLSVKETTLRNPLLTGRNLEWDHAPKVCGPSCWC